MTTIRRVKKSPDDYCRMYLDFLAHVRELRRSSAYPMLDLAEERLLDQLAASWLTAKKITVLKAMEMSPDASSTTVHRRLKTLRQKKMLELVVDEDDNRVKYIIPTELARSYLAELGRAVERCARGEVEEAVRLAGQRPASSPPADQLEAVGDWTAPRG